jgi:phage FluMu protein Com
MKCSNCGHVNLIPVTEVFHVYENIKCVKCGKVIASHKFINNFTVEAFRIRILTKLVLSSNRRCNPNVLWRTKRNAQSSLC